MLVLIPVMILLLFSPHIYRSHFLKQKFSNEDSILIQQWINEIEASIATRNTSTNHTPKPVLKPHLFNPNTISINDLVEMGLSQRTAKTIENYRTKGGQFRIKSDFSKIFGISASTFNSLYDFIDLPEEIVYKKFEKQPVKIPSPIEKKDFNTAESEDFRAINGIGPVLSKRIVAFRNGLGGFHSMRQVNEVFGLNDTIANEVKTRFYIEDSLSVKKINLSIATAEVLQNHPYINRKLAKTLVAYRAQHPFQSVSDLLGIKIMTDSLYQRLRPYLFVQ